MNYLRMNSIDDLQVVSEAIGRDAARKSGTGTGTGTGTSGPLTVDQLIAGAVYLVPVGGRPERAVYLGMGSRRMGRTGRVLMIRFRLDQSCTVELLASSVGQVRAVRS